MAIEIDERRDVEMVFVNRHNKGTRSILSALLVLLLFHCNVATLAADDESNNTRLNPPQAQYTAEGVERCLQCHGGERMTLMAKTVHGNKDTPQTPYAEHGCESCHGPGSLHVSRARGGTGFPLLMAFRQQEPKEQRIEACLSCHGKELGKRQGMKWTGNIHDNIGMTCGNCHQLHVASDPMNDQQKQREKCSQCHASQLDKHKKMGVSLDKMACFGCHDIHKLTRNK